MRSYLNKMYCNLDIKYKAKKRNKTEKSRKLQYKKAKKWVKITKEDE